MNKRKIVILITLSIVSLMLLFINLSLEGSNNWNVITFISLGIYFREGIEIFIESRKNKKRKK
ncbi:MAG TPA: hypothetical protein DCZ00_01930 [Lactococcus sp.]|nr:hypothetical protein [Lactococcus sp.]